MEDGLGVEMDVYEMGEWCGLGEVGGKGWGCVDCICGKGVWVDGWK